MKQMTRPIGPVCALVFLHACTPDVSDDSQSAAPDASFDIDASLDRSRMDVTAMDPRVPPVEPKNLPPIHCSRTPIGSLVAGWCPSCRDDGCHQPSGVPPMHQVAEPARQEKPRHECARQNRQGWF